MSDDIAKKFSMIRVRGTPSYAEFDNGIKLTKPKPDTYTGQLSVYVEGEGWERNVICADYDNHFVALNPRFKDWYGSWFAYCSCGSPAIVTGYNAYKHGASASSGKGVVPGEMMVCMLHVETGHHMDGST